MAANALRMRRLATPNGSLLMLPIDHGISNGPIAGLAEPAAALRAGALGGASCVALQKGLVPLAGLHAGAMGVLLHLSASTDHAPDRNDKRLVATVREAVRLGCDGVSIHVNMGSLTEARQLEDAGRVATECGDLGMPLFAMVYPRGPAIPDPAPASLVAHAARLGAELGADAVKVPFCAALRDVVQGCPVPVLVAGGAHRDAKAFLAQVREARQAGARGVSVGRNVFQAKDPAKAMAAVAKVFL